MCEGPPKNSHEQEEKSCEQKEKEEHIALAVELSESREVFLYLGINEEYYENVKRDEEEFPGFTTPIDELIKRFEEEGFRVEKGKCLKDAKVFILPSQSDNIEEDSLPPRLLKITEEMDERLKKIISTNDRSWKANKNRKKVG